jgi:hypothetical protein
MKMPKSYQFGQLPQEKLAFIKTLPKIKLEQLGLGDIELEKSEDYLSESSFAESDFELLVSDDFYEVVKDL